VSYPRKGTRQPGVLRSQSVCAPDIKAIRITTKERRVRFTSYEAIILCHLGRCRREDGAAPAFLSIFKSYNRIAVGLTHVRTSLRDNATRGRGDVVAGRKRSRVDVVAESVSFHEYTFSVLMGCKSLRVASAVCEGTSANSRGVSWAWLPVPVDVDAAGAAADLVGVSAALYVTARGVGRVGGWSRHSL